MADDTGAMMNYAGQWMIVAGAGLVGYSVVSSSISINPIGIPASAAMIGVQGMPEKAKKKREAYHENKRAAEKIFTEYLES